jgi:hypothetical protein
VAEHVYSRRFKGGLVVVVPHDGPTGTLHLEHAYYTPEGAKMSGTISVAPGTGLLLLDAPAAEQSETQINFGSREGVGADWEGAALRVERSRAFVSLRKMPAGQEWAHDVLLDPVRSLVERPVLNIRLRTSDPQAGLLLMAEVDDKKRSTPFVLVEVGAARTAVTTSGLAGAVWFRSSSSGRRIPLINASTPMPASGRWGTITLNGRQLFATDSRFTFRRWVFMRPVGAIDMETIESSR